jgi:rod shape-determining protein MreD
MAQRIRREEDIRILLIRARTVPVLTTMAGSLAALLPAVISWPAMPPIGLLMLLSWRLLRPEIWPAWIGLPLGLFDDIFSGQPFGSAMSLWTLLLLVLDLIDSQLIWRDYWIDWLIAAAAILLCIAGGYWFSGLDPANVSLAVMGPQTILSILCFPVMVRLCVRLDRWRLPS